MSEIADKVKNIIAEHLGIDDLGKLTNDELNDSIEIHLSRLAIATTLVNIEEEYNALKSSGRMELLEAERLVTALHDYYSWVAYIKIIQTNIRNIVVDQYLPFMTNYSEYFGLIKDKNIYDNTYPAFELHSVPPKKKMLSNHNFK